MAKKLKPCLIVYFRKALRKRKGSFRDDAGTIIPKEVISFVDDHYIMFCDGWDFVVKEDYFEIIYSRGTFIFSEGRVQNILVNYPSR